MWLETESQDPPHEHVKIMRPTYKELEEDIHLKHTRKIMKNLPEGIRITIPLAAVKAIKGIHRMLKRGGTLRAFDYGFPNYEVLPFYARTVAVGGPHGDMLSNGFTFVRGIGNIAPELPIANTKNVDDSVLTTLVNFPFLARTAKGIGMKAKVEPMTAWIQRVLGKEHTYGPFHTAGIAYKIPGEEKLPTVLGIPAKAIQMVYLHPLQDSRSKVRKSIDTIIQRHGDTPKALTEALDFLHSKGIKFSSEGIPPKRGNEKNYVYGVLSSLLVKKLGGSRGIFTRIQEKAVTSSPGASVSELAKEGGDKFKREIGELKELGFNKEDIRWMLFQQPHNYRYSGALSRISFTAVKK